MRISFSTRLSILFSGITALALASTTLFSWQSASSTATHNAQETLQISQRVFEELLQESQRQLSERGEVLADDFAFREAIATGENETIISALSNHGTRVDAEMMFLLAPSGDIEASTHDLGDLKARQQLIRGSITKLIYSEGDVYQTAVVPVRAPDLLGWVGMGALIDADLARSLKELTQTEVTLVIRTANNGSKVISTLPFFSLSQFSALAPEAAIASIQKEMTERELLSHTFPIDELSNARLNVVLSNSLEQTLQAWRPWHQQLWMIGFAALLMTLLTALVVSRFITRPIRHLMTAANHIAEGDYDTAIGVSGSGEFSFLADTMNTMGAAVRSREKEILRQARFDDTTGLPNRRYLAEMVQEILALDSQKPGFLALIQLHNFQRLNEVYGVDWCDQLMRQLAQTLNQHLQAGHIAARVGGGQFLLFCPDCDGDNELKRVLERIVNALSAPCVCEGIEVDIDLRVGVSRSPDHGSRLEELMRRASIALARASSGSEGAAYYADGEDLKVMRQLRVTQRLQLALKNNGEGLELHYQPKYSLTAGRINQVEALLRWNDAELGRVFPDEFIPLAESSGDILDLSDWVTGQAAAQAARWKEQGIDIQIAINVSGRDFQRKDFVAKTRALVAGAGATPKQFILEVTESAMIENAEQALEHLNQLRASDFTLAIDDFGTGYSSLAQLKLLPVHELKIDKAFILELDSDEADHKIVRSTIELGHNLGLKVVAEGLENYASLAILRDMGCDAIQGYHLARPMDREHFEQWWEDRDINLARALASPAEIEAARQVH